MSNLISVPKNGSLKSTNSKLNFPNWTTNWLDEFLNNDLIYGFSSASNPLMTVPKANIKETPEAYFIDMSIPGLRKSDFIIRLDNHQLSISTNIENELPSEGVKFIRKEFSYKSFKRTFSLPETINDEKIDAKYYNGILSIHLPKRDEAKQKPVKTIKIS